MRASKAKDRSKATTAYLYSWGAVAVCGLAYVGVAATRPDLIGTVLPLADQANDQSYAGRAVADMADELATLRKWVNDIQHDLATTRNALQEQTAQQAALVQRMAAAEDRLPVTREVKADGVNKILAPRVARAAQPQAQTSHQSGSGPQQAATAAARSGADQVAASAPGAPAVDVSNV
ncbi:unnamed protein product, partial [Phaeothamnion confervicola]